MYMHEYQIYFAETRVATLDEMQTNISQTWKSSQSSKYKTVSSILCYIGLHTMQQNI